MKLIKLNTDHYVIVDDSEIKEGDWIVNINGYWKGKIAQSTGEVMDCWKKITHSTEPIEDYTRVDGITIKVYVQVKSIYLYEVKELIGEVDVEKKAEKAFPIISGGHPNINWDRANLQEGFVTGYTQALEDNKGKVYTEEDLFNAIGVAIGLWSPTYASFEEGWKLKILQSLQPKTEWEVEFIDGKLTLKNQTT